MPEPAGASAPAGPAPVRFTPYRPPYLTQSAVGTPPPPPPTTSETVTITLDGREMRVERAKLIITAADEAGVYIPRFCYHPRLKPVGMCRMCLVEVSGPRGFGLAPACYSTVSEGMEIRTTSPAAKKAQDGVLEFLLVNHPLDCPVCDKGGECPLQDQTLAYGPGETRFLEEKRHWDKPIAISELVYLDRERCIQCGRCVRFADEVAGDPLIDFAERGERTEVAAFPDEPYSSYFSGNVVQICPVGALTAKPYRFRARPWDLEQVESTCTVCSVGCRLAVQSSMDELTRHIGVDSDPVNWGWLCDKGRFGYESVMSGARLTAPLVRKAGELVEVSWEEALDAAAEGLRSATRVAGGAQVAVIGGSRLANEDAYAWSKLARVVLGTDNVDAQLGDGLPADVVLGLPRATIDQAASASLVIMLGPDTKEELPVLYLRLRDAAQRGLPIVELSPRATGLSPYCIAALRHQPGQVAAVVRALTGSGPLTSEIGGVAAADIESVRRRLSAVSGRSPSGGPAVVVVLGRPSVAETDATVAEAAALLAGIPGSAFLPALRRSNVLGALDMGLAPGVLPGRVSLDAGRAWYEHHWGSLLPRSRGMDTAGILRDASRGRIGALVLLGADPTTDFPDASLSLRGVVGARFIIAIDCFLNDSSRRADVVLPAAAYAERRGTVTNIEGRVTWLGQLVTAPGVAWPDWMIATELAARLGVDFGWTDLEGIWGEVEQVSPLHRGLGYARMTSDKGRDGTVVPVREAGGTPALRPLDPMADPGIASAEGHQAVPTTVVLRRVSTHAEPGDQDGGVQEKGGAPEPPAVLAAPQAAQFGAPPAVDESALRLVAVRHLWDAGTLVANSRSLAGLHPQPVARMNPDDLFRMDIADATPVVVSSARGTVVLPVRADPGMAQGSVGVPFNLPGASAAALIDSSVPVTEVRIERAAPQRAAQEKAAQEKAAQEKAAQHGG